MSLGFKMLKDLRVRHSSYISKVLQRAMFEGNVATGRFNSFYTTHICKPVLSKIKK